MKKRILLFGILIVKWMVIPVVLFVVWMTLSIIFNPNFSPSIIFFNHTQKSLLQVPKGELLQGEKTSGTFTARENNLGIVAFRFYNFERISDDQVLFRIKQANQQKWYYTNKYKVDQFQPNKLFTFGFPIITDSQGKKYYFEIESLHGKKGDAIGLSNINPIFVSEYQFKFHDLLQNKKMLVSFIAEKYYVFLFDRHFYLESIVFLLPFLFYLFWIVSSNKLKARNFALYITFIVLLGADIFYIPDYSNIVGAVLMIFWLVIVISNKICSNVSFFFSAVMLSFIPLCLLINESQISEKFALEAFMFLFIAVLQLVVESIFKGKRNVIEVLFGKNEDE